MLLSLHIENMAVIRRMDADFDRGFTAITGETGAGKKRNDGKPLSSCRSEGGP